MTRSMVNRTWAHFLGYGFTSPVDDLGPHNIPSNPELLGFFNRQGFRMANRLSLDLKIDPRT